MTIHHIGNLFLSSPTSSDLIYGTVLYKFKPEATPEQRQSVKDSANALPSQIPAIQSLVTGETVFNALGHGYDAGTAFFYIISANRVVDETVLQGLFFYSRA
jgi:hypothetical protein